MVDYGGVSFGFGYDPYCNWNETSDLERAIIATLPHGSGIDYDWRFERRKNGRLVLSNAYHFMDEYGGYRGSLPFSFSFDVNDTSDPHNPGNGRLVFNGLTSSGYYWVDRLDLRDYLEEMLFSLLHEKIVRTCPYCKNGWHHVPATKACHVCNGSGKLPV